MVCPTLRFDMNTFSVPIWERFLQATPQIAFVELELNDPTTIESSFAQISPSTTQVVLTLASDAAELLWMPKEVARATELLDGAIAAAQSRNLAAAICPIATGFPSDIPSTLSFLRARSAIGLVAEPAALLTATMLETAPVHLDRVKSSLLSHDRLVGLVVSNTRWADGVATRCALADGEIPAKQLERLNTEFPAHIWVATVQKA